MGWGGADRREYDPPQERPTTIAVTCSQAPQTYVCAQVIYMWRVGAYEHTCTGSAFVCVELCGTCMWH